MYGEGDLLFFHTIGGGWICVLRWDMLMKVGRDLKCHKHCQCSPLNDIVVYRNDRILLFCVRKGPVIFLYCWLALDLCAPVGHANKSRQGLKKSTTTPADAPNPSKQ